MEEDIGELTSVMNATALVASHYLREEKQTLHNLIKSISVVNIVTEEDKLLSPCNKIKEFLEDTTKGQYIFTSVNNLLNNHSLVLPEWRSSKNVLVVAFEEKCELFSFLCMNICEVLYNDDKKRLILVSKAGNIVTSEFQKFGVSYSQFFDDEKYQKNFPLHGAAAHGNVDDVQAFMNMNRNANLNNRDYKGRTAFYCAAAEGEIKVMDHLTRFGGVNIITPNEEGWSPIHCASVNGCFPTLKFLLNLGVGINLKNQEGDTPLHFAAACGQVRVIKYLLKKGSFINAKNQDGDTPLIEAVCRGQIETCGVLIESGSNIHLTNNKGFSALHGAAFFGHLTMVVWLVDKGASVNAKTIDGDTPLHEASECNNLEVVKLLLSKGAAINSPNKVGDTPLHCAAKWARIETVKYLLSNGADMGAVNRDSKTPFDLATGLTKIEMAQYFNLYMGCIGI